MSWRLLAVTAMAGVGLALSVPSSAQSPFLGALGCSQTRDAIIGHHLAGYTESWELSSGVYSGGHIYEWGPDSTRWNTFESFLDQYPQTTDIWWELCISMQESPTPSADDYTQIDLIGAELAQRAPGLTIWVSPMNGYDGVNCSLSGTYGTDVAKQLADYAAAQGYARRAFDTPNLDAATVADDGCHANDAGKIMWGETLQAFFFGFDGTFSDDDGNIHEANIEIIAAAGITQGCGGTRYCPTDPVTRDQMASFLARMLNLPPATIDYFTDDTGNTHEANINAIAAAGITLGVGDGRYDPDGVVTRDQMASFLARALGLPASTVDHFVDDTGNTHEANINAIADAAITLGCDQTGTRYCPTDPVRRDQMASFLARSLTLAST